MGVFWDVLIKVAQGVTTIITLLLLCIKPFRTWFLNLQNRKKEEDERENNRDEASRCSLRNIMTQFYYLHNQEKQINQYEYENMAKVYAAYKHMGGNSFVDKIWEEMQGWTIV
jgi:hypothetical protein